MTEAEWLACTESWRMVDFLQGRASERKLRLFAVECCHRVSGRVLRGREQWFRAAISIAEQFVERSGMELATLHEQTIPFDTPETVIQGLSDPDALRSARQTALAAAELAGWHTADVWRTRAEHKLQAMRLRDIFGNPFRPGTVDPAWLTSTVVALARSVYDERAFDGLPILADALQDAGCDSADVLDHCRGPGPHVRGCWVVDLLLGKT
jgi:hypothetical protein